MKLEHIEVMIEISDVRLSKGSAYGAKMVQQFGHLIRKIRLLRVYF